MSKIKLELTEDQVRFLINLIHDHVVSSAVRQPEVRRGFGIRILEQLGGKQPKVDHSRSAEIINAKLASGELKLPRVS